MIVLPFTAIAVKLIEDSTQLFSSLVGYELEAISTIYLIISYLWFRYYQEFERLGIYI